MHFYFPHTHTHLLLLLVLLNLVIIYCCCTYVGSFQKERISCWRYERTGPSLTRSFNTTHTHTEGGVVCTSPSFLWLV